MRLATLLFIFIFHSLASCSGSGKNTEAQRKIPIDANRWYQLNHTLHGLGFLFNGNKYDKVNTSEGAILSNYDAWYPLLNGEQMTIDAIKMFDGEGTNENHPTTIYAVTKDWQRVPIAVFKGLAYNEWVGPNPDNANKYSLSKPVSDVRYLVINTWGNLPGEIEFYGSYKPPRPISKLKIKYAPLKNFCGINVFEWDFESPDNSMQLDPRRVQAVKNFTAVRHYVDWEKLESKQGRYAFAPTYNGSWNYDTIYQWCKAQNIDVLACIKTIPSWMQSTYPDNEKDDENTPMPYGKDPSQPSSYLQQAKVAFQFAARYGNNKKISPSLLTLEEHNRVRTGLDVVHYVECDNERDKWWKGRKAYQTGREYAANLSAFYDGNKNTLGPGVGIKNADPAMKVVMCGLADPSTDYLRGMIDWCKEHRGYRNDGSPDLPWDVINYHFYANDAGVNPSARPTTGIAPELSPADSIARQFVEISHIYANDMPIWITEAGYDINQGSPQKAPATVKKSAEITQADWILRTALLYAGTGIERLFLYQLHDDNPGSPARYATCGLINKDNTARPAANYLSQVNKLFGKYTYAATMSRQPLVKKYSSGKDNMYMLVIPDGFDKTVIYPLNMGNTDEAIVYTPDTGSQKAFAAARKYVKGAMNVTVTETPTFIVAKRPD